MKGLPVRKKHCLNRAAPLLFSLCLFAGWVCRAQDTAVQPAIAKTDTAPAAAPQQPVSEPRRLADSLKRLFSVQAVTSTVPSAVVEQFHDWPDEWGRHGSGFARRTGSLYGQFVVGVAIEDSIKAIDHEDTHFSRRGHGNFFGRTAHIITGTVLAHKPDGSRMVAWSYPANAYGSWAIATLWSPREYRTVASIAEWGTAGLGGTAGLNFFRRILARSQISLPAQVAARYPKGGGDSRFRQHKHRPGQQDDEQRTAKGEPLPRSRLQPGGHQQHHPEREQVNRRGYRIQELGAVFRIHPRADVNISGFCKSKSAGFFSNITTQESSMDMMFGRLAKATTANTCLRSDGRRHHPPPPTL